VFIILYPFYLSHLRKLRKWSYFFRTAFISTVFWNLGLLYVIRWTGVFSCTIIVLLNIQWAWLKLFWISFVAHLWSIVKFQCIFLLFYGSYLGCQVGSYLSLTYSAFLLFYCNLWDKNLH
jgi:hypothetical protein